MQTRPHPRPIEDDDHGTVPLYMTYHHPICGTGWYQVGWTRGRADAKRRRAPRKKQRRRRAVNDDDDDVDDVNDVP